MASDLLIKLRDTRTKANAIKEQMKNLVEAVTKSSQYERLQSVLTELNLDAEAIYNDVTHDFEQEYAELHDKHPAPGVEIKFVRELHYDESAVREWCLKNFTPALRLDTKILENTAKTTAIPGVDVIEKPKVYIAQDLSKFYPEV